MCKSSISKNGCDIAAVLKP